MGRKLDDINIRPASGERIMIQTAEMLEVFQQYRGNAVVIPGRGGRHWVKTSTQPDRDVPLGDPAMGGHASFALGFGPVQAK